MAAKSKTIKNIEVDGIALAVDTARLEDVRFTYALGKVSAEETPDAEKLVWYSRMLDALFGADAYSVMCKVAGDGTLTADAWSDFYMKVLEEVGQKN